MTSSWLVLYDRSKPTLLYYIAMRVYHRSPVAFTTGRVNVGKDLVRGYYFILKLCSVIMKREEFA